MLCMAVGQTDGQNIIVRIYIDMLCRVRERVQEGKEGE